MTRKKLLIALFGLFFIQTIPLTGYDNHHFYRASSFFGEPRFEKPWLGSFDVTVAGGSSCTGINNSGCKTCLLDSWGLHNMQALGAHVPGLDPTNPADAAVIALGNLPKRDCFGLLSFAGKFSIVEANCSYIQNFTHGLFGQLHIPIRTIKLATTQFRDYSPQNSREPNAHSPEWLAFLQQLDAIMSRHNLCACDYRHTGIGDMSVLAGWTKNYEETEVLDYVDFTIKTGLLLPTARAKNENNPFDIPFGYNKHLGFPLMVDCSFGVFEWLTAGAHFGTLFFLDKTKDIRMKTDCAQSGLIKLAQGCAKIAKGPLWDIGSYIKIDHARQALSFILGYTYANKTSDTLHPYDTTVFKSSIVNSDELYKGWAMHTLHILLEYDLNQEEKKVGPRIGITYNQALDGKRIFKTSLWGGSLGLDIQWDLG